MIRRLFSLLSLFIWSVATLCAQNIAVADFRLAEDDLTANMHGTIVYDQNGEKCALIKVETTQRGFTFDAGVLGVVKTEEKPGEIWVYVPDKVKRLTISHPQLGILRDYDLGQTVQKGRTYILMLTTGSVQTVVHQTLMSQYLVFTVTPDDAVLRVNGAPWPIFDGASQRFVSFGTYHYRVEAPEHHPVEGTVEVNNPDKKSFVHVSLQPAYGWIEVTGDDSSAGASVYIDHRLVGTAPMKSARLSSGVHSVMLVKPMYRSVEQMVEVTDSATTTFSPSLAVDFAEVQLTTDAAAEIWVNGERKGVGSWSGRLATGEYQIETRRENHRSQTSVHRFAPASGVQTLQLSAPTPIYGSLNVAMTPINAEVFVDGTSVGNTPLFLQRVLIGHHVLTLKKQGYGDYRTEVNITEGQVSTVEGKMSDIPQTLSTHVRSTFENKTFTVNGVSFTMVAVKCGTFQMGATKEQKSPTRYELPIHKVTLNDYYIGETEVTQELWKAVMGTNPSSSKGDNLPVDRVSWNDCQIFISKLNKITGTKFSLPTEAQWEYAARGGNQSRGYQYSGSNYVGIVAWNPNNSSGKLHPVKTRQPNELGLYDMSGNVWEWCQDYYGYYSRKPQIDPQGPTSGNPRVYRGGSWNFSSKGCRVSYRGKKSPNALDNYFGFRLALSVPTSVSKSSTSSTSQSVLDAAQKREIKK